MSVPAVIVRRTLTAALLLTVCAKLQSQDWYWKNPLPQGNDIIAMCSAGNGIIYGVGGFGAVIKSTNGGANWFLLETPVTIDLRGVAFVTPDRGVAVGDGGTLLQTSDGGISWQQKIVSSSASFYGVSFVDSAIGTVVGYPGMIFRTTDGGMTWKQQLAGSGDHLYAVQFLDENRGTIVGSQGVIFRTTNAGRFWEREVDSTTRNLYGLWLADSMNGYAVGDNGVVLHSSDGGKNWKPQQSGTSFRLNGVSFSDANNGTIVGESSSILTTTDGGTAWITRSPGFATSLTAVHQVDAMTSVALGSSGVAVRTTDGGLNWEKRSVGVTVPLSSISLSDVLHGVAVGLEGTILTSDDGGNSWATRSSGVSDYLHSIVSLNNDTAIAVGENGALLRTEDGGLAWANISLPPVPGDVHQYSGIAFSPAGKGLIVGQLSRNVGQATWHYSLVLRSSDGGSNWTSSLIYIPQYPDSLHHSWLRSAAFVDSSTVIAVGSGGTILRSTDSGVTWDSIVSGTSANLNSVAFSKSRIGIGTAVGEGEGTVLWTTDGGTTWDRVQILGQTLRSVSYGDTTFAVAVGHNGRIFYTFSGGQHWTNVTLTGTSRIMVLRTDKDLLGVSVADGNIVVVGDGGVILGSVSPDIPVRAQSAESSIPSSMGLSQNYPNPFNPTTAISYQLSSVSDIRLTIYDVLGREVAVLVDERKPAGTHQVTWNASNLPSGMYICRLSAEGAVFARKLLLIK